MRPETKHITGDNHDYHGPVNGDQYYGQVRACQVAGGCGHKNSFNLNGPSVFKGGGFIYTHSYQLQINSSSCHIKDPQLQGTGDDELLNAKIALVRAQHENKRLAKELATIQEQLVNAKEELELARTE